ncbi:MAG TPA: hypothetical protein VEK08_19890 [Planctomycetota bacterium]|nr:hypothetical protein [Planctomycetota bacterium]
MSEIRGAMSSSIVDNLRFKIVSRDGQHFFTEVRLKGCGLSERERSSIVKLLDGESLENLTPHYVSSHLKQTRHATEVQDMISQLQAVLCL